MSYDTFRDNDENKNEGTTPPASPYGQPQGAPYAYNQQQAPQQAGGFSVMGLTWEKNVVPNPATNGMPPTNQKSNASAYALWFFFGFLGVHQFYLGNTSRGLFNLVLWIVATILGSLTGGLLGLAYLVYWIYEAVTLNDQTHEVNSGLLRKSIL
jgi:TM2 domain-containing membrane protein YozV